MTDAFQAGGDARDRRYIIRLVVWNVIGACFDSLWRLYRYCDKDEDHRDGVMTNL